MNLRSWRPERRWLGSQWTNSLEMLNLVYSTGRITFIAGAPDWPHKLVLDLYLLTHERWPEPIKAASFWGQRWTCPNSVLTDSEHGVVRVTQLLVVRGLEAVTKEVCGSPTHLPLSFHWWSSLCLDPSVAGIWMENEQLPQALKHCNLAPRCRAAI